MDALRDPGARGELKADGESGGRARKRKKRNRDNKRESLACD